MKLTLPKHIKAAVFDLDGTLIISSHIWGEIDKMFLAKRGLEVPDDYVKEIACLNFREGADYTISRFGLDEDPDDIIAEWFGMARYEYAHNIRMKEGAEKFLRGLKAKGFRIALATASNPALYIPVLENNGVMDCFDAFASTEEVCRSKLFPDVYIFAAGKLGASVRDCVVFEDQLQCIESAKSAGFMVCGCLDDYRAADHSCIKDAADICFESYDEFDLSL